MDLGISGKRAAVAASSAGLGYGAAAALVAEGVTVAICGRDGAKLADAAARLGPNAVAIEADVSTAAGARGFVEEGAARLGGVDILAPHARGPPPGRLAAPARAIGGAPRGERRG